MEAKLIVIRGKANRREVALRLPSVIGRSREADLTIGHPMVSRRHCEVFETDGVLMIHDLDSLNGTLVNGERISEAQVDPNAEVTVGPLTFRIAIEEAVAGGVHFEPVEEFVFEPVEEGHAPPESMETEPAVEQPISDTADLTDLIDAPAMVSSPVPVLVPASPRDAIPVSPGVLIIEEEPEPTSPPPTPAAMEPEAVAAEAAAATADEVFVFEQEGFQAAESAAEAAAAEPEPVEEAEASVPASPPPAKKEPPKKEKKSWWPFGGGKAKKGPTKPAAKPAAAPAKPAASAPAKKSAPEFDDMAFDAIKGDAAGQSAQGGDDALDDFLKGLK